MYPRLRIPRTLLAILLLAIYVRGTTLGESLWLDELHTAWAVSGTAGDCLRRAAMGNQGPLYFLLVWTVTQIAGLSELTLRAVSLTAGLLLVATTWHLIHRWTRRRSLAGLCALFVAIDPYAIFYAQEARPYALLQWIALVQWLPFLAALGFPRATTGPAPRSNRSAVMRQDATKGLVAWIALSAAMFHLHYTAVLLIAGQWLILLLLITIERCDPLRNRLRLEWRPAANISPALFFAASLGLLATVVPAYWHTAQIAAHREQWSQFVPRPFATDLLTLLPLDRYLLWPSLLAAAVRLWGRQHDLLARKEATDETKNSSPIRSREEESQRAPFTLACLLLAWFALTLGIAWSLSRMDVARLFYRRYLIGVGVVPIIVAGLLADRLVARRYVRPYVVLCLLLVIALTAGRYRGPWWSPHSQEDWRAAVTWINDNTSADLPVLLKAGLVESDRLLAKPTDRWREYCLFPVRGIYRLTPTSRTVIPLPNDLATASPSLMNEATLALGASGQGWLMLRGRLADRTQFVKQLTDRLHQERADWEVRVGPKRCFGRICLLPVFVHPG